MKSQTTSPTVQVTPGDVAAEVQRLLGFPAETSAQDVRSSSQFVYCLFCRTGREQLIANELAKRNIDCLIAYVNRIVVRGGRETVEQRRLFPGYVFLETPFRLSRFALVEGGLPDALRLLSYEHGECALRGADLAFYRRLKEHRGVIELSQVYQEGDRIRVIGGSLKDYEGNIVAVNKKRKCVAISLGEGSLMSRIWCSVEYVERKDVSETLP